MAIALRDPRPILELGNWTGRSRCDLSFASWGSACPSLSYPQLSLWAACLRRCAANTSALDSPGDSKSSSRLNPKGWIGSFRSRRLGRKFRFSERDRNAAAIAWFGCQTRMSLGVTLGHENGPVLLEWSLVFKDRPRLGGLLRGIFEAKIGCYLVDNMLVVRLSDLGVVVKHKDRRAPVTGEERGTLKQSG